MLDVAWACVLACVDGIELQGGVLPHAAESSGPGAPAAPAPGGGGGSVEEGMGEAVAAVVEVAVIIDGVCEGPWLLPASALRDGTAASASAAACAAGHLNNDNDYHNNIDGGGGGGGDGSDNDINDGRSTREDSGRYSLGHWYRMYRRQRR